MKFRMHSHILKRQNIYSYRNPISNDQVLRTVVLVVGFSDLETMRILIGTRTLHSFEVNLGDNTVLPILVHTIVVGVKGHVGNL